LKKSSIRNIIVALFWTDEIK